MGESVKRSFKKFAAHYPGLSNPGLDQANTEPCKKGKHFCAFMDAALAEKGPLTEAFDMKGASAVIFHRKRREPFLVLSVCPWCKEPV